MRIGIVGSGKVGAALGRWASKTGAEVAFTSRDPDHAKRAALESNHGARALDLATLVAESELILLTLPFAEVISALTPVKDALAKKTLVDVTNPLAEDHKDLAIGHDDSGAEQIARAFPEAHVVKAFNAVFAEVYQAQTPVIGNQKVAIFHASDDANSKAKVAELISQLGFEPIDAGPLRNARFLEPLSLLNIHLGRFLGRGTNIGFSLARDR